MKVMVAGSRGIDNINIDQYMPADMTMLISGGARGVDTLAEKYADRMNIPKTIIRPDYPRYGKCAPLVRNREMVEMADLVVIIWDGKSHGTGYTLDYAIKCNKHIRLNYIE